MSGQRHTIIDSGTLSAAVRSALVRLVRPVTAVQLARELAPMYRARPADVKIVLDALAEEGTAWRWRPGAVDYYCGFDPHIAAQVRILEQLRDGDRTASELAARMTLLPGYGTSLKHVTGHLGPLLATGRVFEHPPASGKGPVRYSLRAPALDAYLDDAVRELIRVADRLGRPIAVVYRSLGQRLGLTPSRIESAGGSEPGLPNHEALILEAMVLVEPRAVERALVSLRDLRRAVFLSKAEFDAAVLGLARKGRVALHFHDFPASLGPEERDALVQDERGTFYVGVVLKETR